MSKNNSNMFLFRRYIWTCEHWSISFAWGLMMCSDGSLICGPTAESGHLVSILQSVGLGAVYLITHSKHRLMLLWGIRWLSKRRVSGDLHLWDSWGEWNYSFQSLSRAIVGQVDKIGPAILMILPSSMTLIMEHCIKVGPIFSKHFLNCTITNALRKMAEEVY